MARYSEHDTTDVYNAAERFRDECLRRNGSMLTDGNDLWTRQNLARLHNVFVAAPEESDRSFIDKYRDQVGPAGADIVQLAAEVLCVYFLFPSNVGGRRKRELVNEVLSWQGGALAPDHVVTRAFNSGVGSGGQGYNTRRPLELAFLIDFAISWKKLSETEQRGALDDPWTFQSRVDSVDGAEARQLRHILLHLLFPDYFERIASGSHKHRILTAFSGLAKSTEGNEDHQLLEIRTELARLLETEELDFYWPPLVEAWYDKAEAGEDFGPLEVIRHKKQIVFFGPPGTGKTFRARRLAEQIIRSEALLRMGAAAYFNSQPAISALLKNNIHRLQLHPAYSYEDFIGGLHITNGATKYHPGYLPRLMESMRGQGLLPGLPHVLILDEINRTDLSRMLGECFSLLEDRNQLIELTAEDEHGVPVCLQIPDNLFIIGTMNLIDQSIEQVDFALRRRFFWKECPFDSEALLATCESLWREKDIDVDWEKVEPDFWRLGEAADALNAEIRASALLGRQYEIGHTYFFDVVHFLQDDIGTRPRRRNSFLWRNGEALRPIQELWRLSLWPLLHSYLSGLEETAREAELSRLEQVFLVPEGE